MEEIVKILINPLILAILYIVRRFLIGDMNRGHVAILFVYLYLASIPFTPKTIYKIWSIDNTIIFEHRYDAAVVLSGVVPKKC